MHTAFLIGRILFGGYFLWSGLQHFLRHAMVTEYVAAKHIPAPGVAVAVGGLMLVLGALSILLGAWPRLGGAFIILFLLIATPVMHNFWAANDPGTAMNDMINFTKNMALVGAALMFYGIPKPWPKSVGR
jgi:uncharacterized membrane protein YphA (DoxX/SURF4 family)